ncbi:PREDICTED: RAS protein activator like-3 isoform X2 [Condylura cristata]|uniref:RAS protein activator like-3 isoform X2 n=1 Tax=Condylura cristata TaxID=143302 RepID=UPI0006430F08|nr:PREDICTED: RAS protein activator like-3 isoform X2 [Condylura cristata]
MDLRLESQASQDAQPAAPSPLTSYRWLTGSGREKGVRGFHWRRFSDWGRALSHQEPIISSQQAPRSLFRRVLSEPHKESRTSRLRLSKSLWGRHKSPPLETQPAPEASEPETQTPAPQIPEAPSPDVPVWNIGAFTLLDGKLVLLGGEEEDPHRSRVGSASSESSIQVAMGNFRDPDKISGKPEPETAAPCQVHNIRGLLKRLKEKKKAKLDPGASTHRDGAPSTLGSRESLTTLSELDLGAEQDVRVWPLHPSLVEEPHCFQVTWTGGSRCFSCRSAAEKDRWIEDLRRHFHSSQDNAEREETWLSVWVHEVKGLPRTAAGAPGVRAELWLDGALLARTAPRTGPGQLFWAERFHFEALPPARHLSLRLHGASPGGTVLGRVALELEELSVPRAPAAGLERWFPLLGAPAGAALRARIRARRLRVLPSERYKELAEFVTFHYARLCGALEPALSAQAKEELAAAMVRVLQATGRAQALVTDLGTAELARCGGREALLFRENTLATKAIDEYMKLVAQDYLQETLGQVVRRLCASTEDCEVDPSKCPAPELPNHQARLRNSCEEVFENIIHSNDWFPAELGTVFSSWREACKAHGSEALGPRLVCASLFLRLLCPAILSPSLFGLAPEHPAPSPARTLTLIAKVIQNLANRAPQPVIAWNHCQPSYKPLRRDSLYLYLCQCAFPRSTPACLLERSPTSCSPGTCPSILHSSPRASPCAAFRALGVGPGPNPRMSSLQGCPSGCSAHRASRLAAPLATALLPDPRRDPKAPYARVPQPVADPGPGPHLHCLGSPPCPGSASWTCLEKQTGRWARTDRLASWQSCSARWPLFVRSRRPCPEFWSH